MSDAHGCAEISRVCFYLHTLDIISFSCTDSFLLSSFREPIGLDDVDTDIPAPVGAVIAPAASASAVRKRQPAPHRTSKDAERAAKRARLETTKRDSTSTVASKTSRRAAEQGAIGGE